MELDWPCALDPCGTHKDQGEQAVHHKTGDGKRRSTAGRTTLEKAEGTGLDQSEVETYCYGLMPLN